MRSLLAATVALSVGLTMTSVAAFALPRDGQANTGTIAGTVRDTSGHVVTQGEARATSGSREVGHVPVASDGTFTFYQVPEGRIGIVVTDRTGQALAMDSVTVVAGQTASVNSFMLTTAGLSVAGAGMAGARVAADHRALFDTLAVAAARGISGGILPAATTNAMVTPSAVADSAQPRTDRVDNSGRIISGSITSTFAPAAPGGDRDGIARDPVNEVLVNLGGVVQDVPPGMLILVNINGVVHSVPAGGSVLVYINGVLQRVDVSTCTFHAATGFCSAPVSTSH